MKKPYSMEWDYRTPIFFRDGIIVTPEDLLERANLSVILENDQKEMIKCLQRARDDIQQIVEELNCLIKIKH